MSNPPLVIFLPDGTTLLDAEPEGVKNLYPIGTVMVLAGEWLNYTAAYRIKESAVRWKYSGMGCIGDILKPEHKAVLFLLGYDLYIDPYAVVYEEMDKAIMEQAKCQPTT